MAISNRERVGKGLELLQSGLGPFVEREVKAAVESRKLNAHRLRDYLEDPMLKSKSMSEWDAAALLKLMWQMWNDVFRNTLGQAERSYVNELRGHRNRWAHQENFSSDDAYRALDSAHRLLTAIAAPQAEEIDKLRMELLRVRFDEQARGERRKKAQTTIEGTGAANLKPWREVVTPHKDVASGRYQQAEFAADLWQVHLGQGTSEYRDPVEFFRRTFLTESLNGLLEGAIRRLAGQGGDPVVQLQTNFGGGKTHSMLALYHLFSGISPTELQGIEDVMQKAEAERLPKAARAVLVGTKISPSSPSEKPDGTVIRTMWGELAWQLGGKAAYARIAADDENATSPGDMLRELFIDYGPCLILIDEWVAYARQLHDQGDLPAGGFETQFSFAQALTEAAKLAGNCLLAISLPASDTHGSPHAQADDVEVGGRRGREALDRLRNVVGRLESSWRPASAEEGFEIVRRRLFEPFSDPTQYKDRDVVARAFADFYRAEQQEFPPECRDSDYEKRIRAAYPIHPEIFDRLYGDWSTLVKFQRTRGVLRLMAAVIHTLWEKGDSNPLILPASIAVDDRHVQFELTRYLPDNWPPVIEKDVGGPNSLPLRIDSDVPNLGKFSACRRVARTIYLGSAPTAGAAHRGIEDRRVALGCVMPGERPAIFGDALRRLAGAATYLYQDGQRYWYSTQPTVTKLAEDRAEQLVREPDRLEQEIDKRLRTNLNQSGDFRRIHPLPQSSQDVPDEREARLVVLGLEHTYSRVDNSPAESAAKALLEARGNTPRLYRNALVFLAPDKARLQDLDAAVRRYLAWESILAEQEALDLSPFQMKQARTQWEVASEQVTSRLPETYQWLLTPVQSQPQAPVEWRAIRLAGQDPLAVRASKRLRADELLVTRFAGTRLRMELDRVPLWRGNHVMAKQLADDFAQYVYLPRLSGSHVLLRSMEDGVGLLTWEQDGFGFADTFDEVAGRYRGLKGGQVVSLEDVSTSGMLVKPKIAKVQLEAETQEAPQGDGKDPAQQDGNGGVSDEGDTPPEQEPAQPRRFHGAVRLDETRVGRDASRIADEVISHLAGLVGAQVKVTLEIAAEIPGGAPEHVVRTVTENGQTLKFESHGFEKE
ncbi:MAG: Swt1 family HEPN domain-containing protein [Gammaproteobacteria bacterium]|nr:Swt1 family HEPN domain-containing protein [Gammaproteobacteria bacterium]